MIKITLALIAMLFPALTWAEIQFKEVTYQDGDQQLKGYLVWDDAKKGKRPGVMVVHEWWGLNDYVKTRARMLAEEGYVAFAADMYGADKVTTHAEDASGWMKQITANQQAWQKRALAGLEQLKMHSLLLFLKYHFTLFQ